jgi:hypothetical protein
MLRVQFGRPKPGRIHRRIVLQKPISLVKPVQNVVIAESNLVLNPHGDAIPAQTSLKSPPKSGFLQIFRRGFNRIQKANQNLPRNIPLLAQARMVQTAGAGMKGRERKQDANSRGHET